MMGWFMSGGKRRWGVEVMESDSGLKPSGSRIDVSAPKGSSSGSYHQVGKESNRVVESEISAPLKVGDVVNIRASHTRPARPPRGGYRPVRGQEEEGGFF